MKTRNFSIVIIAAISLVLNIVAANAQTEMKSKPVSINHRGGQFYYDENDKSWNEALEHFRVSAFGMYNIDAKGFGYGVTFGYEWQHKNFKGFALDLRLSSVRDELYDHRYLSSGADLMFSYELFKTIPGNYCKKSPMSLSIGLIGGYGHYENYSREDDDIIIRGNSLRGGAFARLNIRITNNIRAFIAAEYTVTNKVALNDTNYYETGSMAGSEMNQNDNKYVSAGIAFHF